MILYGSMIGVIKGDTWSLEYGSCKLPLGVSKWGTRPHLGVNYTGV